MVVVCAHDSLTSKYVATSRVVRPRSHAASTSPRNSFEYGFMDTFMGMPTLPTLPGGVVLGGMRSSEPNTTPSGPTVRLVT